MIFHTANNHMLPQFQLLIGPLSHVTTQKVLEILKSQKTKIILENWTVLPSINQTKPLLATDVKYPQKLIWMEDDFKTFSTFLNTPLSPSPPMASRCQAGQAFALQRDDVAPRAAVRVLTPKLRESGYLYPGQFPWEQTR